MQAVYPASMKLKEFLQQQRMEHFPPFLHRITFSLLDKGKSGTEALELCDSSPVSQAQRGGMAGVPSWGHAPVPGPAGVRTQLIWNLPPALTPLFCPISISGGIQPGAEWSYQHRNTRGAFGKPSPGGNRGVPAPGVVSWAQWDREVNSQAIPDLCSVQSLRSCSRKCPCASRTRQKSHTRTESCLLWPLQTRKNETFSSQGWETPLKSHQEPRPEQSEHYLTIIQLFWNSIPFSRRKLKNAEQVLAGVNERPPEHFGETWVFISLQKFTPLPSSNTLSNQ